MPWRAALIVAALALALGGCSTVRYYAQAVHGHFDLVARERPIAEVIEDPATPAPIAERLRRVVHMREFAVTELALPDNGSYRAYANLGRDHVVYSVVAAPALSLEPIQSCFPVAGCVSYRGYYRLQAAAAAAREHRAAGHDVYVAPVPAYSTLGWFDDPVPSSLLRGPEWAVAGTLFHELSHQRVYLSGDTGFNEAYASAVQREGVARWLAAFGSDAERRAHAHAAHRREQFLDLVRSARERLAGIYAMQVSKPERLALKRDELRRLRAAYDGLRSTWQGYRGYDRWFAQDLNNAKLALVGTYNDLVPEFSGLIAGLGGDMARFHAMVRCIGAFDTERRRELLRRAARSQRTSGRGSGSHRSPCSSIAG